MMFFLLLENRIASCRIGNGQKLHENRNSEMDVYRTQHIFALIHSLRVADTKSPQHYIKGCASGSMLTMSLYFAFSSVTNLCVLWLEESLPSPSA